MIGVCQPCLQRLNLGQWPRHNGCFGHVDGGDVQMRAQQLFHRRRAFRHGCHRPRRGRIHHLTAQGDDAQRICQSHRPRRHRPRIFTDAMGKNRIGFDAPAFPMLGVGILQNEQRRNGIAGPAQFAARLGILQRAGEHHLMQIGGRIFWQGGKAGRNRAGKSGRLCQHASTRTGILRAATGKQEHDARGCAPRAALLHKGRGFGGKRRCQIVSPSRRNRHAFSKRTSPTAQSKGNIGRIGYVRP